MVCVLMFTLWQLFVLKIGLFGSECKGSGLSLRCEVVAHDSSYSVCVTSLIAWSYLLSSHLCALPCRHMLTSWLFVVYVAR